MSNLTDKTCIDLPLRKCGPDKHSQYLRYVLSEDPTDYIDKENDEKLKANFGSNASLFNSRFQCLTVSIRENEEMHQYVGYMNELISQFNSDSLNGERFRYLIFILGLTQTKMRRYTHAYVHFCIGIHK